MQNHECPRCQNDEIVKSGIVKKRQRYTCKKCRYNFTVPKMGKEIDSYYVVKALQLYLEGISYREIERILGVSHVSVMNWVKKYKIKSPVQRDYRPTYIILTQDELADYFKENTNLQGRGMLISELGDKYMLIKWERFKD